MNLKTVKRIVISTGIGLALIIGWFSFTETISQGHVGVVFNKAKGGVQEQPLDEGLHFVSPLSRITEYPVSTETVKYKLSLPTGDTKTIVIPVSFDYHNESAKTPAIYREWRGQKAEDLQNGYLRRNLLSIASDVTSKYTILELNANRGKIQTQILKEFTERVGKKGFIIASVNLGTPEYDAETQQAIQQVVNKQQELKAMELEKQKAELQAEKDKIVAQGQATAEIEKAKGEAESKRIQAEATASANQTINSSLTENVLKLEEIKARQKHGWVTINGATPLVESK
jgi:regulator of protease activity HflC (stomatin/prohibitin superfamily)